MAIRAAIIGGTGYGGMELVRYLLGHSEVKITAITSRTETGALGDVHPHLRGLTDLKFTAERAVDLAKTNDVLFFATPNGVAKKEVPDVLAASATVRVIDLSADFRHVAHLDADFVASKGKELKPEGLVYGLPECGNRDAIRERSCRLVANPGCHASAAILGLFPIASSVDGLVYPGERAVIVSVTGSSGSGATPSQGTHHPERFANFRAYKPLRHPHESEISLSLWELADMQDPNLAFVPCSGPFVRGIGSTIVVDIGKRLREAGVALLDDDAGLAALRTAFANSYGSEPFVRLVPETAEVRAVAGTNFVDIGLAIHHHVACITVAIDNLGKGMAGTAIQNMNLLFGIPETTGLMRPGAGL